MGIKRRGQKGRKQKRGEKAEKQSQNKTELQLSGQNKNIRKLRIQTTSTLLPPLLLFQSLSDSTVTNTLFASQPFPPPALPPHLPAPPDSLCLTSFLFISVSNSLQLPPSIGPSVSSSAVLPLAPLNLLSTVRGVSIWQGNFLQIVVENRNLNMKNSKHISKV